MNVVLAIPLITFVLLYAGECFASPEGSVEVHTHETKRHLHGTHEECPLPNSSEDIVECSLQMHPAVQRLRYSAQASKALKKEAEQIPNPSLSARYIQGESNGSKVYESEASLLFPIELGGKRDARVSQAVSERGEVQARLYQRRAKVKTQTILKLHRLRQIRVEKKAREDALSGIGKVIKNLKKLPRLSAEQEASLTMSEMAEDETKVLYSQLLDEEKEIEHYFHVATGHSLSEIVSFLPEPPKDWPKFGFVRKGHLEERGKSPAIKVAKAQETLSLESLKIERANAWPDLNVGPSLQLVKGEADEQNTLIGVSLSFSLPLFHINEGGKANALANHIKSRKLKELVIKEESHERAEQLRVYQGALSLLRSTMGKARLDRKQKKIQKLYLRGLVPSSVFLESQRQKSDYIKGRHEREMTALKALWSLYTFDGKIFEVKI